MKTLFIEARRKNLSFKADSFSGMPGKLHILYSIQYKELAQEIAKKLGNKVLAIEQVLGCSRIKPQASLLLIGSGRFHAIQIAFDTKQPVYVYDSGKINEITEAEIQEYEKKERAKLAKFLMANTIGIIISTKPGQNKKVNIKKIEKKYPDKKFYLFLADNINLAELENFQIDFWVNTACPGLAMDSSKIINIDKIKK